MNNREITGQFKKGHKPHNKGLLGYKNNGSFKKGVNHPNWSGNNPSYSAIHKWIVRNFGKATKCINKCKAKKYDWSNISGLYKRDVNDWQQLCRKCHIAFDMTDERKIQMQKIAKDKFSKKVIQYDDNLRLVKEFDSAAEAAKSVNGDPSSITKVARRARLTAYGYIWRYYE